MSHTTLKCRLVIRAALVLAVLSSPLSRPAGAIRQDDRYAAYDQLLDTYVRDGRVYYKALRTDRARLDRFVQGLDVASSELARWTVDERKAFWLNAYNALVLKTVIDAYPIRGSAAAYPRSSIRQISGAFERTQHQVAGARLTLDAIESRIESEFGDARMLLAIGRGAAGGGRLRSEAFRSDVLSRQLEETVKECATRAVCISVDLGTKTVTASPLFGWRREAFERSFGPAVEGRWPMRSAIERAIAAMIFPFMFSRERELIASDTFRLEYGQFDWSLNEL